MAVDPYLVYAYWSAAPGADDPQAQAALRFHDISDSSSFDVDVDLRARNWYVHLWSPERTYVVDLGLRREDGGFIALARSNVVETPPAWPRLTVEEAATLVEPDSPRAEAAPRTEAPAAVAAVPPEPAEAPAPEVAAEAPAGQAAPAVPKPVTAGEVLERKLAEMAALREQPLPGTPAPAGQEAYSDLTDLSEEEYRSGASSLLVRSRRSGQ